MPDEISAESARGAKKMTHTETTCKEAAWITIGYKYIRLIAAHNCRAVALFPSKLWNNSTKTRRKTTTMKTIIFLSAMIVLAVAAPQAGKDATILKFENDVSPEGYKFAYETSDGIAREEQGTLKDLGGEDGQAIVITGSFNWKDEKTGQLYSVTFTADENGYKPQFKAAK